MIVNPPIKDNTAFIAGESLTYEMHYGIFLAGTTQLLLTEDIYNNKQVFHSFSIAQTAGLADKIYGVTDIYESWFDKETNLPYKDEIKVKEGRYERYNEVTYNRKNNTVNSKKSGIDTVPELILDLSSVLYYVRRVDFSKIKEGDVILLNMYFSDEVFPFRFKYNGEETIKTKFGKINCLKLSPVVQVGRVFKHSDDLTLWISNDCNYIPILISLDIRVAGTVNLRLTKYENTANALVFKK